MGLDVDRAGVPGGRAGDAVTGVTFHRWGGTVHRGAALVAVITDTGYEKRRHRWQVVLSAASGAEGLLGHYHTLTAAKQAVRDALEVTANVG